MRWARSVLLVALAPACGDASGTEPGECSILSREVRSGALFEVVAFGHNFEVFCEGGFDTAQEHAQWVADAWGETPAAFDYGLFDSGQEPCWPCDQLSPGALGCAFSGSLSATQLPQRHEIAHAIRGLPCSPLLEEGWAMLYGDHFVDAETVGDLRQAADAVESGVLAGVYYPFAARFVAFLLETRGLDGMKALCGLETSDAEALDAALLQVFDQSFDEVSAEFDDYPEWSLGQLRQDQACEGGDITDSPGTWSVPLVCGGVGVEGRVGGQLVTHHLVELPQEGAYVFQLKAPVDFHVRLELRNCEREGMVSTYYGTEHIYGQAGAPKDLLLFDLPAGVYVVRVMLEDSAESLALEMGVGPWP